MPTFKKLTLYLGNESDRRKAALLLLCEAAGIIGRNGQPSISELLVRLADATEKEPDRVAAVLKELIPPE